MQFRASVLRKTLFTSIVRTHTQAPYCAGLNVQELVSTCREGLVTKKEKLIVELVERSSFHTVPTRRMESTAMEEQGTTP